MRETVYVVTSSSGSSPAADVKCRARLVTYTHCRWITRLAGEQQPTREAVKLEAKSLPN